MVTSTAPEAALLRDLVAGPVFAAGDPDLPGELASFNASARHAPSLVVGAVSTSDVQAAVRFAAERDLTVGVHATGHGAARSYRSGVVVSTRRMSGLTIDPEAKTARVGAGVQWRAVIDAAAAHGLAPLNGSSSSVGAVGYTVGGGLPVLGRTFGWSSDLARSFELVMADGRSVTASRDHDPDIFAALRGGKPDAGIVTAMTIDLVPVHTVYGGAIFWPGEHARRLIHAYRDWSAGLSEAWTTSFKLLRLPNLPDVPEPLRGKFSLQLAVAFVGTAADGERGLAPMRRLTPALIDGVGPLAYRDIDLVHHDPVHPIPVRETCVLLRDLDDGALERIEAVAGPDSICPFVMVEIRQLGGALGRPASTPDSVGARDAGHVVFFLGALPGTTASVMQDALDAAVATMAPATMGGRTFVNMHGAPTSAEDRARAWPAETYRRLRRVKADYDPDGRFRFVHTLADEFEPALAEVRP